VTDVELVRGVVNGGGDVEFFVAAVAHRKKPPYGHIHSL
jgi:hypothetical protein